MIRLSVLVCSNVTAGKVLSRGLGIALLASGLIVGCNGFPPSGNGQENPTQFSETACAVGYYDEAYGYGFELPADAELIRTKNETNSLSNSLWTIEISGALVNIITRVQVASDDASLGTLVSFENDLAVAAGADLSEEEVSLSNGGVGIQTIARFDGLTTFRVQALAHSRLYEVEAIVEASAASGDIAETLSELVMSLCID